MQVNNIQQFQEALSKIDCLYHVKEFKSLSETKINHMKEQEKYLTPYYKKQIRKMYLHTIYLYYVAYLKKVNFYIYPRICVNKWGVLFRYYCFNQPFGNLMKKIDCENFQQNIINQFKEIWKLSEEITQNNETQKKQINTQYHRWESFGQTVIEFDEKNIAPNEIINQLQDKQFMKENMLILGVLSSTLFPCIKSNKSVELVYNNTLSDQLLIIKKIFNPHYVNEGNTQFTNYIVRFFKILNDFKVVNITTTLSDKLSPTSEDNQSLLTEFQILFNRSLKVRDKNQEVNCIDTSINSSSNKSSQHEYSQSSKSEINKQIKCQFFWKKRIQSKDLSFRASIFINKKIFPLHYAEIESIWYKLCQKWKVILDKNKQLSDFNPGFITMEHNKDTQQISFTQYIKYQPPQHILSELMLTTDKLIISYLIMKEIIIFYEKKGASTDIYQQKLVMTQGVLEDMSRSVCQCIKNYNIYRQKILASLNNANIYN